MSIITTIIESLAPRIINGVDKKALSKIKMKLCGKIQVGGLSMSACELIVSAMESGCVMEKANKLFVSVGSNNKPFVSGIPEEDRRSEKETLTELCDCGLLTQFADRIYLTTKKAQRNQDLLKRQDDVRVFAYAPETLKSFYPLMAHSDAIIGIPFWDDTKARIEIRREGKNGFRGVLVSRREAERIFEYLWHEDLLDEMWFTNQNSDRLFGLTIDESLDLATISSFFFGDIPVCLCGAVSKRGQRVARIKLDKLNEYIKSEE